MKALAQFKHRVLYANIINDRSAPYYTTYITRIDPYIDLSSIEINYLKGWGPTIIDPANPVSKKPLDPSETLLTRMASRSQTFLTQVPFVAAMVLLIPIGSVLFLVNSGIQSVRSQKRIKLHESGQAGVGLGSYRIPLMVENARSAVEDTFGGMHGTSLQETLPAGTDQDKRWRSDSANEKSEGNGQLKASNRRRSSSFRPRFPILNLSHEQFDMIENLDSVGWRKYAVHIHDARHTHAAIIVRMARKAFNEGKRVVQHWLDEEFEV